MSDGSRVDFTRSAADRIARVVRIVEGGDRGQDGPGFSRVWEEATPTKPFRVCAFTGSWTKTTFKTVSFKNQTSTPNTVSAVNIFANVVTSGTAFCAIARDGTAWYLIAAEC